MNTPRFIIAMQKKGDKLSQGERDRLLRDITAVSCFFFLRVVRCFFLYSSTIVIISFIPTVLFAR